MNRSRRLARQSRNISHVVVHCNVPVYFEIDVEEGEIELCRVESGERSEPLAFYAGGSGAELVPTDPRVKAARAIVDDPDSGCDWRIE